MHPPGHLKSTHRPPGSPWHPWLSTHCSMGPILLHGDPFCSSPAPCQHQPHPACRHSAALRPPHTHYYATKGKKNPTKQQPTLPFQKVALRLLCFPPSDIMNLRAQQWVSSPGAQAAPGTAAGCCRMQRLQHGEHHHHSQLFTRGMQTSTSR